MPDDVLLTRIENVSAFYRGAHYHLSYCSEDGGVWAYELVAAFPPDGAQEDANEGIPPIIVAYLSSRVRGGPSEGPVFAMRCGSLEVIASALEHWHAQTLTREF